MSTDPLFGHAVQAPIDQRAERDAARQRQPGGAEPDGGRKQQRETGTEEQAHVDPIESFEATALSRRGTFRQT